MRPCYSRDLILGVTCGLPPLAPRVFESWPPSSHGEGPLVLGHVFHASTRVPVHTWCSGRLWWRTVSTTREQPLLALWAPSGDTEHLGGCPRPLHPGILGNVHLWPEGSGDSWRLANSQAYLSRAGYASCYCRVPRFLLWFSHFHGVAGRCSKASCQRHPASPYFPPSLRLLPLDLLS